GAYGELAAESLAGIVERVVDEITLLAAPGLFDIDPAPGAGGQRFFHHLRLGEGMAEKDEPRRGAVFVELADKGFEHFGIRQAGIGTRPVGVAAPVLVSAEEEDLDAELAAFMVDREDVGFLDIARGGIALRLDQRKGGEAIADEGGALEIELFGGLVHLELEVIAHALRFSGKEEARILDQLGIAFEADFAGTGRCAALDLELQARTGARGVEAVRTVAQEE